MAASLPPALINMNINYQSFEESHIDQVMAIEEAAQQYPMNQRVMLSCLGKRYFNVLATVDGQPVGFYIGEYVAGEASVIEICVAPDQQGKGLGRLLMQHFIEQAQALGAQSCWLEVRESNVAAQKLYASLDFNELDRRKNYYPTEQGREDALMMSLWI